MSAQSTTRRGSVALTGVNFPKPFLTPLRFAPSAIRQFGRCSLFNRTARNIRDSRRFHGHAAQPKGSLRNFTLREFAKCPLQRTCGMLFRRGDHIRPEQEHSHEDTNECHRCRRPRPLPPSLVEPTAQIEEPRPACSAHAIPSRPGNLQPIRACRTLVLRRFRRCAAIRAPRRWPAPDRRPIAAGRLFWLYHRRRV